MRRTGFYAAGILLLLFASGVALSQEVSVADAARQSRSKPKKARVITDDDLPRRIADAGVSVAAASVPTSKGDSAPPAIASADTPAAAPAAASGSTPEHDDSMPCPADLVQQLRERQAQLNSSLRELQGSISAEEDGERRRRIEGVARVTAEQIDLVRKQLAVAEKNVGIPVKGCPGTAADKSNEKTEGPIAAEKTKP